MSRNMDNSSDEESEILNLTPPQIKELAKVTCLKLIPEKSKKKYEITYRHFMDWRKNQHINSFSETILLAYFGEIAKKFKSTTLWSQYSMLKSMLIINEGMDISTYNKLKAFLKRQSDGYQPKKSNIFAPEEISKFINEAPDNEYLMTKVSCILGIMGACRRQELYNMKTTDINDTGSIILVTVPDTKTKITRKFTITGNYYTIFKKYTSLRPSQAKEDHFFLNYQKGKCTIQKVGINKFGSMGKQIAMFLKLPNPELFTSHCFRRTSATILVDAGGDITTLKRHGGWKSTTVAESYIDDSLKNKLNLANKIMTAVDNTNLQPSTSRNATNFVNVTDMTFNDTKTPLNIVLNNCSNVTFNFNNNN